MLVLLRGPSAGKGEFFQGRVFIVKHFAGEVDYCTDQMLEKNKDKFPTHLEVMLSSCQGFDFLAQV